MRIAVIADIHGNIHALEQVLRDIDRQRVDHIIVNGDLVNRGPNNIDVLERLVPLGLPTTLGNHEDFLYHFARENSDGIPGEWYADPFWQSTRRVAKQLAEKGWDSYFAGLEMTIQPEIPAAPPVIIAHGTPRHNREGLGRYTPQAVLDDLSRDYPAAVYVGSHIHAQWLLQRNGHTFVNTGAVGMPFNRDPRAQYLILELRQEGWHCDFRAVEYDRQAAIDAYEKSGYLRPGDLATMLFREEMRLARALFGPYWRWIEETGEKPGWQSWRLFQERYPERYAGILSGAGEGNS